MLASSSQCAGVRKDGSPCKGQPLPTSRYCWAHDPANQERVLAARSAGGKARASARRAEKLLPGVLRPVLDKLLKALDEVHDGDLAARQGEVLASLAGAIVRVYEVGALEERLSAVEEASRDAGLRRLSS